MIFDQVADMLSQIRNAQMARSREVVLPASKLKMAVAKVLLESGYLEKVALLKNQEKTSLKITIKYLADGRPKIKGIKKISHPGQRIYVGKDKIAQVKNGFGISIISTSKGVMTGKAAKEAGVGGELICQVW